MVSPLKPCSMSRSRVAARMAAWASALRGRPGPRRPWGRGHGRGDGRSPPVGGPGFDRATGPACPNRPDHAAAGTARGHAGGAEPGKAPGWCKHGRMPGSFRDGGRARQPTRGRRLRAGILSATLVTLLAAGTVGSPARRTAAIEDHGRRLATGAAPGWQLPVHVASPTELVGFRWAGATEGAVEMRVRRQGQWSSWLRVEGNPSEGPDRTSPEFRGRTAAGPVWVGSDVH